MKLPTLDLHITHPKFTLPYFSRLAHFRNINKFSFTGASSSATPMMEKMLSRVLSNNRGLTDLVLYLLDRPSQNMPGIEMRGIDRIFPKRSITNLSLRHLAFKECNIVAAPHIFRHLRHLQTLQIFDYEIYNRSAEFWIELTRQKIYVPCIQIKRAGLPSALIDYLVSNQGMLELSLEIQATVGITKRVLSEVVPCHSRTLEVLHLSSAWTAYWVIDHCDEYIPGVSQCSKLRVLGMTVSYKGFLEPLLHLLKFLPRLQTLRLAALYGYYYTTMECIDSIRADEPVLMALHIIVIDTSRPRNAKLAAGASEWDVDDVKPDVLLDIPWECGINVL
ncbi:hypothetical protein EDD18DRAFT_562021 [Armillaria luteobubalina]|uniref:Uncharacterized protein n=1 Tax=Armillaria luteobubalina TaxID=153913 RepID=A0AA39URQ2_9AGAR|nr:hypothetical protein EDD18DRAFT_562021 [Armillaria luteobubalina]